ncbi:two-component sensor histidine kinase [Candidatus Poribacteria bacterium]|nr:MAG: two-component sensor histidine kinase [Candidatus Poribacteria bacterium]
MNVTWWLIPSGLILILAVGILVVAARRRGYPRAQRLNTESPKPAHPLTRELVHEIRNPLNSVNLNLQILEEDLSAENANSSSDLQKRVQRIRREVERLDRILTDFRRYANLPPLTFESCDIAVLIEEVLDFDEPEAQKQNVEVKREIEVLPLVQLDQSQFKQALLNLIINGVQAMEDGGTLTVRAKPLDEGVHIEVEDTGLGIDPEQFDKIFDLFISTKEEGTGVGLTIVKQIIEGHGGRVNVESNPDQGTKFSIVLPTLK